VIDDPVKGRIEANSAQIRERTWAWFADDFLSRFSENSAMLIIMTRWHVDDLLGRFIERYKGEMRVRRYPAISEHKTRYRRVGDALFPELKSAAFLAERKGLLTECGGHAKACLRLLHCPQLAAAQVPAHSSNFRRSASLTAEPFHSYRPRFSRRFNRCC
jgi:hypothetical protein